MAKKVNSPALPLDLFQAAIRAQKNSHSPYSGCKVGAALRTQKDQIFSGCNVENATYGATVCAERTAIANAVSASGKLQIKEMVVVTSASPPWPPCGICRQVLAEFSNLGPKSDGPRIFLANPQRQFAVYSLKQLFPEGFGMNQLPKTIRP